jgi:hypothetical protein
MSNREPVATIQRCPHDKANPYVMVNNNLIRDNSISPECRWLLIYLLTNEDGWVIKTTHLINHLKGHKGYGRDRILEILNEAIEAGYMKRETYLENNLTRHRYLLSETPKFSNKFSDALNARAPGARAPETRALKNNQSIPNGSNKDKNNQEYKEPPGSAPPSADAESLYVFFLDQLRERNPKFKEPNKDKWVKEFDLLLRVDKRDLEEVKELIVWSGTHKWFKVSCLSPSNLRKNYDAMVMQKAGDAEQDLVRTNRAYALKMKEKYPEEMQGMSFDDKYAYNRPAGKEIPFSLPEETFKRGLISMFGGTYGG